MREKYEKSASISISKIKLIKIMLIKSICGSHLLKRYYREACKSMNLDYWTADLGNSIFKETVSQKKFQDIVPTVL